MGLVDCHDFESTQKILDEINSRYGRMEYSIYDGTREYRDVKGHHVHAKAGFEGSSTYDLETGFCISQKFMRDNRLNHADMTAEQRRQFKELHDSGRPNTLEEHTRIAEEALYAGGASDQMVNDFIFESLVNLDEQGTIAPTRIPWYTK